jgi:pectate disaccharide-lyase
MVAVAGTTPEGKSHLGRRQGRPLFLAIALCVAGAAAVSSCGGTGSSGGTSGSGGSTGSGTGGASGGNGGTTGGNGGTTGGSGGTTGGAGGTTGGAGGTTGTGGTTGGAGGATGAGGTAGRGGAGGTTGAGGMVATGGTTGTGGAGGTPVTVNEYWIGPTGSDANPGTQALPFASLTHAHALARPGVTIWVLPGTYHFLTPMVVSVMGTQAAPINVFAAPGARPIIDYATQPRDTAGARGIDIRADWWHFKGLEVRNAGDNCIAISGSHNTIEQVIVDGCDDTGIQITGSTATDASFNTILNCDSHDNFDMTTNGENADGIDAKLMIGPGNMFKGCRSWNNSDDGYDLFGVTQVVTIDNCWAMLNGQTSTGKTGPAADGNGFKLGGNHVPAVHKVTNSFAMSNNTCGFTLNNNTAQPMVTGCGVNLNQSTWCDGLAHSGDVTITMTGAQAVAAQRDANGNLPPIH